MKLQELRALLQTSPEAQPRFVLPDGEEIPAHFHLTEIGYVAKNFIDCGGTIRKSEACVLQLWANDDDADHRLTAGKFASILALGDRVLPHFALEVEVEWDCCVISQYRIDAFEASAERLEFQLSAKHTDCLAREQCSVGGDAGGCGTGEMSRSLTAVACC